MRKIGVLSASLFVVVAFATLAAQRGAGMGPMRYDVTAAAFIS